MSGMERFTQRARRVLSLAHQEAEVIAAGASLALHEQSLELEIRQLLVGVFEVGARKTLRRKDRVSVRSKRIKRVHIKDYMENVVRTYLGLCDVEYLDAIAHPFNTGNTRPAALPEDYPAHLLKELASIHE